VTPIERFLRGLLEIEAFDVVKIFLVIGMIIYLIFAVVMIRQVQLMSRTLNGTLDVPLRAIVIGHFLVALGVMLVVWLGL